MNWFNINKYMERNKYMRIDAIMGELERDFYVETMQ